VIADNFQKQDRRHVVPVNLHPHRLGLNTKLFRAWELLGNETIQERAL
jgi:hypothetical protein